MIKRLFNFVNHDDPRLKKHLVSSYYKMDQQKARLHPTLMPGYKEKMAKLKAQQALVNNGDSPTGSSPKKKQPPVWARLAQKQPDDENRKRSQPSADKKKESSPTSSKNSISKPNKSS